MGMQCKGLLFSSIWDGAKRIEEVTHKVIYSVDGLVCNISVKQLIKFEYKTNLVTEHSLLNL